MLKAVLYVSDISLSSSDNEKNIIEQIISSSKKSNSEQNITGVLAYHNKRFFHVFEGNSSQVDQLFNNIKNDTRHANLTTVLDLEVNERVFKDWQMIERRSHRYADLLGLFLQNHINQLPLIEQDAHDLLELFIEDIFS